MIKISDEFSIARVKSGWTVYQKCFGTYLGKPIERVKKSYHPTMERAMVHVRDLECGECTTLDEILKIIRRPM